MTERRHRHRRRRDRLQALWTTGIVVLLALSGIWWLLSPLYQHVSGTVAVPLAYVPPAVAKPAAPVASPPTLPENKQ